MFIQNVELLFIIDLICYKKDSDLLAFVFQNWFCQLDVLVAAQGPDFDGSGCRQGQDDVVIAVSRSQNMKCRNPKNKKF